MKKIVVTEEQAKVIEHRLFNFADKKVHCFGLIERDTKLDLVTIARIVEGESYEVTYEFKVGDVIYSNVSRGTFYLVDAEGNSGRFMSVRFANSHRRHYTLICKAENREDLKEAPNDQR